MDTPVGIVPGLLEVFLEAGKRDTLQIRELKAQLREQERVHGPELAQLQSQLPRLRWAARARHVTYSLWRGRSWAEIESNHPDGDPTLSFEMAAAWRGAARVAKFTGPPPANLQQHLPSGYEWAPSHTDWTRSLLEPAPQGQLRDVAG